MVNYWCTIVTSVAHNFLILFAIIVLGFSAGIIYSVDYVYAVAIYSLTVSLMSLVYSLIRSFIIVHSKRGLMGIVGIQVTFFGLWVLSFALYLHDFVNVSCIEYGYVDKQLHKYIFEGCKLGKASIVTTGLIWLIFTVDTIVLLIYGIFPLSSDQAVFERGHLLPLSVYFDSAISESDESSIDDNFGTPKLSPKSV
ncbi:uncharacterized protein RJT20DRAFT_127683 [Scheffersomyces xylosifermentans]|uniref:uncharacterized protein n=1 Tax=Scheffersomyces xylosifermentans TaxID=1304137 RepID=UPI00315CA0C1